MINHARTRILNLAVTNNPGPYEEYIPPTYAPETYTGWFRTLQQALIPSDTSREQANLSARLLTQLMHVPDLEPYTLALDPRVTYLKHTADQAPSVISSAAKPDVSSSVARVISAAIHTNLAIFNKSKSYQDVIEELNVRWSTVSDEGLKAGIVAIAFVYQVEEAYG